MKYIINNNIKYHEDRSELESLKDAAPPVVLTATLNRLLSALIRNNNQVLSRDTLLTQVWEAHGQVASGNNLNNAISILRKAFSSLGEEEIIVTLPRQGFMFTAAELNTADSQSEPMPTGEAVAADDFSETPPRRRGSRIRRFALTALLALAAASSVWAWQDAGYMPLSTVTVGHIGSCEVRFVTSFHKPAPGERDLAHLRAMLAKDGRRRCNEPATLLYYDSHSLVPNTSGRLRVAYYYYCPQAQMTTGTAQCENIYESQDL
ncbi:winged helix-turn-helix domain-containing protein [Serratia marcescens]|uniref:winged helix-turn-helix domain-containing protein n=1 Tax=Serratia marcescens TaxID=615 RepID=UPI001C55AE66|nr:winged helix-turn-helix domain-containing protein [Serratia marcescens]QXX96913.1 winged helix-turn-helix domain-containing protein [Serratia marcescens]